MKIFLSLIPCFARTFVYLDFVFCHPVLSYKRPLNIFSILQQSYFIYLARNNSSTVCITPAILNQVYLVHSDTNGSHVAVFVCLVLIWWTRLVSEMFECKLLSSIGIRFLFCAFTKHSLPDKTSGIENNDTSEK